jgi:hypothetical protein
MCSKCIIWWLLVAKTGSKGVVKIPIKDFELLAVVVMDIGTNKLTRPA